MQALEITKKDLLLQRRDIRALAILVILPLIFILILGTTFGKLLGWKAQNQVLNIAFVDNIDYTKIKDDDSDKQHALGAKEIQRNIRQVVVNLMNSLQARQGIAVFEVSAEEARNQVESGAAQASVTIGPDFAVRVGDLGLADILDQRDPERKLTGGLPRLDMEVHQRKGFEGTGSVVEQMVFADTVRNLAGYVACREGGLIRAKIASRCEEYEAPFSDSAPKPTLDPPQAIEQEGQGKASAVYDRVVPGLTVMFVFFLVNIMARSFIHERELGTLRRLQIAPIGPASLLLGKTIPFLVVSLVQSAILFGAGRLLFKMSFGPQPWLLLPVAFCTSLAATALGLLVAALVKTDSQVSAYTNIVVITMAGISGCLVPRDMLPPQLLAISNFTPHAWAVEAFKELLPDDQSYPNTMVIAKSCGMLLAFSLAFFTVGVFRFSRTK